MLNLLMLVQEVATEVAVAKNTNALLGAGIGANIPHVEVTRPSGTTSEYQLGGVTGQLMLGVDYKFTDHISAFTEYKFNYSRLDVDIDSGDKLKTNILTNAVSFGLSYNF